MRSPASGRRDRTRHPDGAMSTERQPLLPLPTPSKCRALVWTPDTSAILEALGLTPLDLTPSSDLGQDLRPREFRGAWFSVCREDPAAPIYILRRSLRSPGDELDTPFDARESFRHLDPPQGTPASQEEQAAGDALITAATAGTGPTGQALRDWLSLWGWQRPAKVVTAAPPPPMVV
jgi:hypothetical protein